VKTERNLAESSKEGCGSKKDCFAAAATDNDNDDDDDDYLQIFRVIKSAEDLSYCNPTLHREKKLYEK
jgi:hypothetical protein